MRALLRALSGATYAMSILLALLATPAATSASAHEGYLRFPALHGNQIIFSAEDDLWSVAATGGEARRVTSHPGAEVSPRYSPDGRWLAFGGDYDGNRDVYVMPSQGGEPRRLTWHPAPDDPVGWSPDGKILFRSRRDHPHGNWEMYTVSTAGGDEVKIPIGYAGHLAVDRESGRYAFTRTGGGGTWKRYRGGTADDIWVGDPAGADYTPVTDFPGMDGQPMWHGGRIWFLSDQGGTANIWSMLPDGGDRRRHTDFGEWDARWPYMHEGRIVFGLAGDLHIFDTADDSVQPVPVQLPSERLLTRNRYPDPARFLTRFALAPDGDRLVVETRGEILSVPVKEGITLPITRGSGARESRASFDAEGARVVYVTDESGEEAIVTADAWGRGEVRKVAGPGESAWHFAPTISPDGKWIAWADQTQTLLIAPAAGGAPIRVDQCGQREIREYSWSPDGRWLAYAKHNRVDWGALFIYDTKERIARQVTSWTTDDRSPAWDPAGRYLYFLSDRTVNPVIDWLDFETIVVNPSRPYMLLLRSDVENPLAKLEGGPPAPGEERKKAEERRKAEEKRKAKREAEAKRDEEGKRGGGAGGGASGPGRPSGNGSNDDPLKPVEIEFDGLSERFVELPVEPGRYSALSADRERVFYLSTPQIGMAEEPRENDDPRPTLMVFDMDKKKARPFLHGVGGYDLQPRSGKIAVQKQRGELYVFDADRIPGDDLKESKVVLDGLVIELDPQEEWRQIFQEGWRNMREFYWDPQMHGIDWEVVRDQYAALLPRIATRGELVDLLGEMIGELATSHTYVWGGDAGVDVPRRSTGLLGVDLVREGTAFRVARIHRGDPADRIRSPLQEPEVAVREGEYILAVNHRGFASDRPFEASLENLAGTNVLLTVNRRPTMDGARQVVARSMEPHEAQRLLYVDWVRRNREYVAEQTAGRIGYIHIPDMGGRGLKEFDTWFYPQLDKEGMVVDVRWNGGGFVSQLIVSRFLRQLLWWDRARWGGVSTYPYRVLNGPFVVLTNQFAGSDGDIFPAAIQTAGAAPVIGKRSWGGVIGIRGNARPLVDMGIMTNPEFAWWHPERGWGIENHGVDPDIEIDNLPQEIARGVDAQLDRGIEEVLRLHRENPPQHPVFAPGPDRSRAAYRVAEPIGIAIDDGDDDGTTREPSDGP